MLAIILLKIHQNSLQRKHKGLSNLESTTSETRRDTPEQSEKAAIIIYFLL